jgi:hypothetical protein
MVDFGFRQGPGEFSTAGIARAMWRIENERERRREPKDAVSGWTLYRSGFKTFNQVQSQGEARDSNAGI